MGKMLMVTEEGNKNSNVVRTQRTKTKTRRMSLRRNRKHKVEWRRNRTRINIKFRKRRSGEGDRCEQLVNFIARNPGISLRIPKIPWIRIHRTNPYPVSLFDSFENFSLNAGHLIRVSLSETWRIIITGRKALRLRACVRVFSMGNESRLYLIDLIQKLYHIQAAGHKYLPT